MKALLTIATLLLSTSVHASYWTCEGKKVTAQFGQNAEGLLLTATSKNSEIPGNLVYSMVKSEDISFRGTGKSMKDVKAVFARNGMYEAGLNIRDGGFYLADKNGVTVFDENMKCRYSAGE